MDDGGQTGYSVYYIVVVVNIFYIKSTSFVICFHSFCFPTVAVHVFTLLFFFSFVMFKVENVKFSGAVFDRIVVPAALVIHVIHRVHMTPTTGSSDTRHFTGQDKNSDKTFSYFYATNSIFSHSCPHLFPRHIIQLLCFLFLGEYI